MRKRTVHVSRHLRRNPLTVTTPHPRQFAKPRTPPKQGGARTWGGDRARPRKPARPTPRKVLVTALTLEDFDIVANQPRRILGKSVKPESVVEAGQVVGSESKELTGIARGKEVLIFVRRDPRGEVKGRALFKPAFGEPDWEDDFGIPKAQQYVRESVMSTLDKVIGWEVVPTTVVRVVGGNVGSVQEWKDNTRMFYNVQRDNKKYDELDLQKIVALDIISGNIDRHGGNILVDKDGKLWGIDHGGAFPTRRPYHINSQYMSRYAGSPIPATIKRALNDIDEGDLRAALAPLLLDPEMGYLAMEIAVDRWKHLKASGTFPSRDTAERWTERSYSGHKDEAERRGREKSKTIQPREMVAELEEDFDNEMDEDREWCEDCETYHGPDD